MWQAFLVQIGQGILQGIGSKIFDSFFGSKQPDFGAIIADALRALSIDFRQSIESALNKAEYQEAIRSMNAAQRAARHYNLSPETRKDVLDEITINLSTAITNLEALGPPALGAYLTAVSLEVAIIQERAKLYGQSELKVAVCGTIPSAQIHINNMSASLNTWNQSRFTEVFYNPLFETDGESIKFYRLWYKFEGQIYSDSLSRKDFENGVKSKLEEKRLKHIENEWVVLSEPLVTLNEALNKLEDWAASTGISCNVNNVTPLNLLKT
jgi:hypothetical protein